MVQKQNHDHHYPSMTVSTLYICVCVHMYTISLFITDLLCHPSHTPTPTLQMQNNNQFNPPSMNCSYQHHHHPDSIQLHTTTHALCCFVTKCRRFPTRIVCLYYISCLRYTILVGNPQFVPETKADWPKEDITKN